jgi:hypothetical protein
MFTHGAPAARDAGPNLLKISESALRKRSKGIAYRCRNQSLEKKPSYAWARKTPALIRPINAVIVSIIVMSNPPLLEHNDCHVAQSKEFRRRIENGTRLMIWRNSFVSGEPRQANAQRMAGKGPSPAGGTNRRLANATIDSPFRCSPHFRRVRAAICSSLGAEMGCIGDVWPPGAVK